MRRTGTITPPGILVPFGKTIGKSATDDMGRTAPPGRDVPVGRLPINTEIACCGL